MTGAICGTCVNVRLAYRRCLCGARQRQFVVWDGGDYYGESGICLRCGEEFSGAEWVKRPFRPRWRLRNIARAKRMLERKGG